MNRRVATKQNNVCNWCTWQALKENAERDNEEVIIRPATDGGVDIFRVNKCGQRKLVYQMDSLGVACTC